MRRKLSGPLAGRVWVMAVLAGLSSFCSGCSSEPQLHPVYGRVMYKGQPAVGAKVVFHPKDNRGLQTILPTGIVAADGSFTLSSRQQGDGAPAGDYAVIVVWTGKSAKGSAAGGQPPVFQDRLLGAYSNPDKPLLQARIVEGDNELPTFELR